jgi:hypothetical protein
VDEYRNIWEIVIKVVEILMIYHRLMPLILLCVVRGADIVGNIRYNHQFRDSEVFNPRIVLS